MVREEAVERYGDDKKLRPILRREALGQARNNEYDALPLHYLFDAIPVSGSD